MDSRTRSPLPQELGGRMDELLYRDLGPSLVTVSKERSRHFFHVNKQLKDQIFHGDEKIFLLDFLHILPIFLNLRNISAQKPV